MNDQKIQILTEGGKEEEKEEKQAFFDMIKWLIIPALLLFVVGLVRNQFRQVIKSNPFLNFILIGVALFLSILVIKFFINFIKKKENINVKQESTIKVSVKPYQNPLLFKYQVLFNFFGSISILFILTFFLKLPIVLFYILLLPILIYGLVFAFIPFTTILNQENLIINRRTFGMISQWSWSWKEMLPYVKKIEFIEKNRCVVIFTNYPALFQEDKFTPWRYFLIGHYANISIPVKDKSEANQIIEFIERKRSTIQ